MVKLKRLIATLLRAARIPFLRRILLVSLAIVIIYPLINILWLYPAFSQLAVDATEDEAIRLASHLREMYIPREGALRAEQLEEAFQDEVSLLQRDYQLEKLKVFSSTGEIIYSTDEADVGGLNENDYFHQIVANGGTFTKVVKKGNESAEGQQVFADVVETYVPIMDSGRFIGAFELYFDITEQLMALEDLNYRSDLIQVIVGSSFLVMILAISLRMLKAHELNRMLSRAVEQSPNMIMVTDLDGRARYANSAFARITGYAVSEVIGQVPRVLKASQHSAEAHRRLWTALTSQGEWQGEVQSQKKSGETYEELITISPITNATGEVAHGLVVREDITERVRAEQEVRRQKKYFEALLQNNPLAVVTLNMENRIAACNQAFSDMFGYMQKEVIGQELDGLIALDDTLDEAVKYTEQVRVGKIIHSLTKRRRKDGSVIDVELFGVPVIVDGDQVGMLGLYQNIGERIRAEEALRQAKVAAEAATEAKSQFLANMSHEIRTPLNAIVGMTGLLLDEDLTSEQHEFLHTIRRSGDALLAVINDILDFSKIEAGRLDLEEHPFNLRACVEEALDLLAPKASDKGLEMAYYIEGSVPSLVVGDVTRLRQILVNLLSNAVKFTSVGEVVIMVDGRHIDQQKYELHVTVKDTGIGIPEDRMDRLFQSFSQADSSTTRKYGGTGLGLTICKHLAEMMGGRIWVNSEVDKGSTFEFTVQLQAATSQLSPYQLQDQPLLSRKRLLVVDDNITNLTILSRQADSWGMIVRTASSAYEAQEWIARDEAFDIAILDMQMPQTDGLELAERMRQHPNSATLPLVMLTSFGKREEDTYNDLFRAFLTKPVKPSHLYNVLVDILAGSQVRQVVQPEPAPKLDAQMAQGHPLRILVAEDHVVNQQVALRILERLGYRADVAANGFEVISTLERQFYDVVLMDVQMPEMDGVQATRAIRQRWPKSRQPRIIALTAHALAGDRERYLDAGMDDYVSKPVHVDELVKALKKCRALDVPSTGFLVESVEMPTRANGNHHSREWPLDLTWAESMYGEKAEMVLSELLPVFLSSATPLLEEIKAAVAEKDADALTHAAHTLKGTSSSLAVSSLANLCREIEADVIIGNWRLIAEKVKQLSAEYERIASELSDRKAANGSVIGKPTTVAAE